MTKKSLETLMEEARQIIRDLGLTNKMLGNTQVYVFLTLLSMTPEKTWNQASNSLWGITPIMEEIKRLGWAEFKPNTRETIRDECVGVLVDAYLATPNPGNPKRSKNSKYYCYQINPEVLALIKLFGTNNYQIELGKFKQGYLTLKERYAAERKKNRLSVKLPNGKIRTLSPGGQNPLIISIITLFASQYHFDTVLYIGDAENRYNSLFEKNFLESLKIDIERLLNSIEMPDVILYRSDKNVLAIIEAVKTGGEINVERRDRLLNLFENCTAKLSFVNAFEDFQGFKKALKIITWETHAWLADNPTHMIHFNGDKYWLKDD
jgi:hypothetical protein